MVARPDIYVKRDRKAEALAKWTVESYVSYVLGSPDKEHNREMWWRCPLHDDKSPSFAVHPEKQTWFCQGCTAGGNLFEFVIQYHKVDFKGALDILLGESMPAFVPRPERKAPDIRIQKLAPPLSLDIVKERHAYYEASGSTYWEDAGFSRSTIGEQLLGMSSGIRSYLLSDGTWVKFPWQRYTIPWWSGTSPKSMNSRLDDDFVEARISGPDKEHFEMVLFDLNNERVKAGKNPDLTRKDAIQAIYGPKYLRYKDGASEHFPYYNVNLLWERDNAGQIILNANGKPRLKWWDTMIVVEGEKKALALVECGYPAMFMKYSSKVAVNLAVLFSFCERVVILEDPDEAGHTQAMRLLAAIGPRPRSTIIAKPLPGLKGADDMMMAFKLDEWARKYNVLPYFIPRSRKAGQWSSAPLHPRTI